MQKLFIINKAIVLKAKLIILSFFVRIFFIGISRLKKLELPRSHAQANM